jgi:GNAT superfamily N-acetyltransferase
VRTEGIADAARLGFLPLEEATPGQRQLARGVYEVSFPEEVRRPFLELAADPDRAIELALLGESVAGLSVTSWLGSLGWTLLEYLAVAPGLRGGGVGRALWRHVAAQAGYGGARGVVLEIDDPDEPGIDAQERAVRLLRVRFWERAMVDRIPLEGYVMAHPLEDALAILPQIEAALRAIR